MTEPHSTTAGLFIGTGIGLSGTIMGAQVDALLIGLVAAIFVSIWLPTINDRLKATASVAMSSLLAGYGSPVAAAWVAADQSGFADGSPLRLLLALLIGGIAPAIAPVAISRLQLIVGGKAA